MGIINSLLDTDLYKLTMMQAILHHFPRTTAEYKYKCRNIDTDFSDIFDKIKKEVDILCSLRFSESELEYLSKIPFFKSDFIDFLRLFQLNRNHIKIELLKNGHLDITISGSWLLTILFEVPVLSIISEVYFKNQTKSKKIDFNYARDELHRKIELMKNTPNFKFADFGTRRRFSKEWHDEIISKLKDEFGKSFIGTSNILFAKKYDITPIGTMAHEWMQAGQATNVKLTDSQKYMLQKWVDEYRGDLGIALSDVISLDAFLIDFDSYFAKLYDGIRFDSGDPMECCRKIIKHYKKLKIDPKTKSAIFSDSLSFRRAKEILEAFGDQIKVSFGIGTNLTNDFKDFRPLDIVIKMTRCNSLPTAKISDSPEKSMCPDKEYFNFLKKMFDEKIEKFYQNEKSI